MTTAYTSLLGLALPVTGELSGTWGDTVNNSITSLLDSAVAGTTTLSTDADVTLTTTTGAANTAREAILLWTAGGTLTRTITAPAQSKIYTVINASSSTQSIKLVGAGPTTGVTILKGESALCAWNGSDFIKISNTAGAGVFSSITNTGLTSGRVVYSTTGGLETDSANLTFNGTTLTANTLNLTNALGTAYGGTGLTSFTANGVVYASSTSALATGSALTFDGSSLIQTGAASAATSIKLFNNAQTSSGFWVGQGWSSGTDNTGYLLNTASGGAIVFAANNAEQMRLTSTGLGIGTSSPSSKLEVAGAVKATGTGATASANAAVIDYVAGSTSRLISYGPNTTTPGAIQFVGLSSNSSAGDIRATIDSSGNLGLGVTPNTGWAGYKAIQVGTGASFGGYTADVLAFVGSNCYNDNTNWRYLASGNLASRYQQSAGVHQWYIAPSGTAGNAITFTQAMTLFANGNLGVGTTTDSFSAGTGIFVRNASTTATYIGVNHSTGTSSGNDFIAFAYNGTQIGGVTQSGTTAVLYNVTSDQRLKENIVDAESASDLIDAIQVRKYDWKLDGSHQRYGFIAQELVTVAPEAVNQPADPDEMMAVDYSKLVPMLVKEIQSLRKRLADAGIA